LEGCIIEFRNWHEYQGEAKRYESTSWFRHSNKLYEHPVWDELGHAEYRALSYLFQRTSREGHKEGRYEVNPKTDARMARVSVRALSSAIEKLAAHALDICAVHPRGTSFCPVEPGECPGHPPGAPGECTVKSLGNAGATEDDPSSSTTLSASALGKLPKVATPIAELAGDTRNALLERVTEETQRQWLAHFSDVDWLRDWLGQQTLRLRVRQKDLTNLDTYVTNLLADDWRNRRGRRPTRSSGTKPPPAMVKFLFGGSVVSESRESYETWVREHKAGRRSQPPPPLIEEGSP
jgi:hypothetical protein